VTPARKSALSSYDRIYAAVKKIPRGRVTTYGTSNLRDGTVLPWHRVINAQGRLSLERSGSSSGLTQRLRLQREGVTVDAGGRVSLARFGWRLNDAPRRTRDARTT
jgi:methylated-DNA-protein-cysteine methyltransferase related protein